MRFSGYAKRLIGGLSRGIIGMFFTFILMSTFFLLLSNTDSFIEHPTETAKLIMDSQRKYIEHPIDTIKLFVGSNLAEGDVSTIVEEVKTEPTEIENLVLVYTNKERASNGLEPLVWDGKLALAARNHSQDMIQRGFFAHDNPDGQGPTERFTEMFGYTPEKEVGLGEYIVGVGENLGQISSSGVVEGCGPVSNSDSMALCQVQSWMESPGHRANILDQKYTNLGVGAVKDDKTYYITQVFW